jgi:hypothetical protein
VNAKRLIARFIYPGDGTTLTVRSDAEAEAAASKLVARMLDHGGSHGVLVDKDGEMGPGLDTDEITWDGKRWQVDGHRTKYGGAVLILSEVEEE